MPGPREFRTSPASSQTGSSGNESDWECTPNGTIHSGEPDVPTHQAPRSEASEEPQVFTEDFMRSPTVIRDGGVQRSSTIVEVSPYNEENFHEDDIFESQDEQVVEENDFSDLEDAVSEVEIHGATREDLFRYIDRAFERIIPTIGMEESLVDLHTIRRDSLHRDTRAVSAVWMRTSPIFQALLHEARRQYANIYIEDVDDDFLFQQDGLWEQLFGLGGIDAYLDQREPGTLETPLIYERVDQRGMATDESVASASSVEDEATSLDKLGDSDDESARASTAESTYPDVDMDRPSRASHGSLRSPSAALAQRRSEDESRRRFLGAVVRLYSLYPVFVLRESSARGASNLPAYLNLDSDRAYDARDIVLPSHPAYLQVTRRLAYERLRATTTLRGACGALRGPEDAAERGEQQEPLRDAGTREGTPMSDWSRIDSPRELPTRRHSI